MPRANAKGSKKSASAEEQELLRLRKELMEKQAKLKRQLALEKRQGSGVLQAVRAPPRVLRAPNAIVTHLRHVLVFDSRADTSRDVLRRAPRRHRPPPRGVTRRLETMGT